jgi:hypothetical protein
MALVAVFLLGILNFALLQAVLRSHHPLLAQRPLARLGGRAWFGVEFAVLLGAMLLAGNGYQSWAWAYAGYSAIGGLNAWLILSGRI